LGKFKIESRMTVNDFAVVVFFCFDSLALLFAQKNRNKLCRSCVVCVDVLLISILSFVALIIFSWKRTSYLAENCVEKKFQCSSCEIIV